MLVLRRISGNKTCAENVYHMKVDAWSSLRPRDESDKTAEDKDGAKEATQKRDYQPDSEIKEVLISFGTLFVRHSGDAKRPLIR